MSWFLFALITMFAWGGADLFYKISSNPKEQYTSLKIVSVVGAVMGAHAILYLIITGMPYSLRCVVQYLPVSCLYISSMALGYAGMRYLELSIVSPVSNASGAVAALLCMIFLNETVSVLQGAAIVLMCGGVVALGVLENKKARVPLLGSDGKYKIGFAAILLPVAYCLLDGLGTFADAYVLDTVLTEGEANVSYELTFLLCGAAVFVYVRFIKKSRYTWRMERSKLCAAGLETAGQFTYVYAMADSAVVAAPMVACYSVVSVLLSRLFLKERLSRVQYAAVIVVLAGIAVLGIE